MKHRQRTALILSGAFAFGAYQVGVMLALFSGRCAHQNGEPLSLDSITGTSIGAVNAGLLLSGGSDNWLRAAHFVKDVYLRELANTPANCGQPALRLRGNPASLFSPDCHRPTGSALAEFVEDTARIAETALERTAAFLRSSATVEQRLVRLVDLSVFTSTTRFSEILRRRIDPERLRTSPTAMQVLATNWRSGDLRVFDPRALTNETVHCAIEASAAVPGLVPPVDVDGEPYADGGLVMNTGLGPAIDAGANHLHVVYMDTGVSNMPIVPLRGTADIIYRMLAINLASMLNRDIEIAEKINQGLSRLRDGAPRDEAMGALLRQAKADRPFRHICIHRYRAGSELGGAAGWVSFDYHNLVTLIERGYRETIAHDCGSSGCVLEDPAEAA